MKTEETNKLIAEFMGWNKGYNHTKKFQFYEAWGEDVNQMTPEEMAFHYDWNWLMEVVEKIRSIENVENFNINITNDVIIEGVNFETIQIDCNNKINTLQAVYNACVNFIEWLNEQKSA